jgi:hypothetical protein
MLNDLHSILSTVAGVTIGSVTVFSCIVYLAKKFLDQFLKSNLELYKQKRHLELETAKVALDIEKSKASLVFSKLYEERALIIKDLYTKFVILKESLYDILIGNTSLRDIDFERLKSSSDDITELLKKEKLFLSRNIYSNSLDFLVSCKKLITVIEDEIEYITGIERGIFDGIDINDSPGFQEELNALRTEIVNQIDTILLTLEMQFKETMGIKDEAL